MYLLLHQTFLVLCKTLLSLKYPAVENQRATYKEKEQSECFLSWFLSFLAFYSYVKVRPKIEKTKQNQIQMEKRGNIKLNCTGYLNASKKEIMVKLSVLEPRFPFMFVFGNARNQTQSLGHDSKGPTDKLYSSA